MNIKSVIGLVKLIVNHILITITNENKLSYNTYYQWMYTSIKINLLSSNDNIMTNANKIVVILINLKL